MQTTTYIQHSCTVHEHRLQVPLDHFDKHCRENIEIFAREVVPVGGENLPYLLFLQGGPGGAGPRPGDFRDSWLGEALAEYRLILLDQRGTGQSTPLSTQTLAERGDDQAIADYLGLFLQDQIIADAEVLRQALGAKQWATLGQSYGGFLTLTYLSAHPEAISTSLVTGGLPGLVPIDDIYRRTYPATALRNETYLERYPADEATIRQVAAHLRDTEEYLPTGERLSATRWRTIGSALGMQTGFDVLHYLLEGPFVSVGGERRLSSVFLAQVGARVSFAQQPLYGLLHEAIYAPLTAALTGEGTRWSAERLSAEYPGFALDADPLDESMPWYLTGEHMFRDCFVEDPALGELVGAVDILAERTEWTQVYDLDRLRENSVPVAAAIYYNDMFVPQSLQQDTADLVGARTWITSQYQHDGIRAGSGVYGHLRALLAD